MPVRRRVVFGRISRRLPDALTFDAREFYEDMAVLADSHRTEAEVGNATWIAADMSLTPDNRFLTGVLGFSEADQRRRFDEHTWSWLKGETAETVGASTATTVPFAVDLFGRYVAFTTSTRIRTNNFGVGLMAVINSAVRELDLWPNDWEFDLVVSRAVIDEWIEDNPEVVKFVRKIKIPNPGRNLSSDREEMRALGASRKTEEFSAGWGRLETGSEEFRTLLDGVDTGDTEVRLEARAHGRAARPRFDSNKKADWVEVPDFGGDLELGMSHVLDALANYRRER